MEIQKLFCNYNVQLRCNCPSGKCEPKFYLNPEEPVDEFVPSFGAKSTKGAKKLVPLIIPDGMFETKEQAKTFSKIVEAMRNINEKNCHSKTNKEVAKILMDKDDFFNTYASALDFIRANAPEVSSKSEDSFMQWHDKIFDLLIQATKKKEDVATKFIQNASKNFEEYGYFENWHYPEIL